MLTTSFTSVSGEWVRLMARPASFGRWIVTETVNGCLLTVLGEYRDWSSVLQAVSARKLVLLTVSN